MKTQLFSILTFLTICIGVNAQTSLRTTSLSPSIGTVFTVGSFKYVVTATSPNSEVAVKEYLDVNNLTPTIPSTVFFSTTHIVTSISENAFRGSYSITSVNIPNSVTVIGKGAFQGNSLTSVTLPNALTSIEEDAFRTNLLASITIPASVTTIGRNAFTTNSALVTVVSQSTNPATLLNFTFDDNSLIDLTVPNGSEQAYIDANWYGFKTVNSTDHTFTQNDIVYQILDITNNDEVATYDYVGASTTVSIPASVTNSGSTYNVTTIGGVSFDYNSLTSVTIPNSVTTIGTAAFKNNSLTSLTIPASVTTIGTSAFENNYNLTTVISESTAPATLLSYTFFNNNWGIDLTIPANTSAAYSAAGWVGFDSVTEAACIVNIPDANFKTYLVGNTAINTNNDTEIQCSEATAFTGTINCEWLSILDLTGLEAFTNITELNIEGNSIINLDLSANTALTKLNANINNLTSLNVSAITTLIELNCIDNNLTSIDVSSNTNLDILKVYNNELTSLNVTSNTALTDLECNGNYITSLDVSNNLDLIWLITGNNNITSLDLSANTSLIYLECNDNALTSLNIANGNNGDIYDFNTTNNPNLTCISVDDVAYSNTNWTNIDVQTSFSTNCNPTPITYVNISATGNNDGTSWADAYTSLQDALINAPASNNIWVAKGTYKPHASNANVSFIANNTIYGGFAGTETNVSDRDLSLIHTTNETILSGDLNNDDATTISFNDTTRDDNSKHVLEIATNNIEVNGFTIKDGNANGTGDDRFGAGIFKERNAANTTIKNCVIKNNVSSNSGAGLAITSLDDSIIIIDACIIENNLSPVGSGIDYHMSTPGKTMNITVTNSLFNGNKTDDNGGIKGTGAPAARFRAYYSGVTLTTTLVNNTFVNNNSKGDSGNSAAGNFPVVGLSYNDGAFGTLIIANNIFWDNDTNGNSTASTIGSTNSTALYPVTLISPSFAGNNTDESNYFSSNNTNPNLDANFKLTAASTTEIDGGVNNQIPTGITTTIRGAFPVWEHNQVNAQIFGVDLDVNKKISDQFNYVGNISLLKGNNLTDNIPLIHMPATNFGNRISYKNDNLNQLSISLTHKTILEQKRFPDYNFYTFNAIQQKNVYVDLSSTPPTYSLFGLNTSAVFKTFKTGSLKVELNIENLFNTSYREHLNRLRYFSDELGRNFNLKIKIKY